MGPKHQNEKRYLLSPTREYTVITLDQHGAPWYLELRLRLSYCSKYFMQGSLYMVQYRHHIPFPANKKEEACDTFPEVSYGTAAYTPLARIDEYSRV